MTTSSKIDQQFYDLINLIIKTESRVQKFSRVIIAPSNEKRCETRVLCLSRTFMILAWRVSALMSYTEGMFR